MATQWHKRILSDFSLELEDQTASGYQGCISRTSVGKWIGYFPSERQWWQGGKQRKKTNRLLLFLLLDILRGESFWSLSYPVLLQPESWASLGQDADPQAGWGVIASWRLNPWAGCMSASWELGPWAGRGVMTSWDPWTGGSPSRLRHDNLSRTRSLGTSRRLTSWDPQTGVGCPQDLQRDQCWVGLRVCNFNSLPVCSQQMGIDIMM